MRGNRPCFRMVCKNKLFSNEAGQLPMKVGAFLLNPFRRHGTYALFCNIGGSSKFGGSWKELYLKNKYSHQMKIYFVLLYNV